MLIAPPLTVFAYLLPGLAGVDYTKWGDTALFPELATSIDGHSLGIWVAIGRMFRTAGLFGAVVFSDSRFPFVLASDGYSPAALVARHPHFGASMISIIAYCTVYALLYGVSLLLQFASLIRL